MIPPTTLVLSTWFSFQNKWQRRADKKGATCSIPITITFEQATGKNVLLLPMGSSTDAAHSINEKLDRRNYIEGTKLLGAYLHYVAEEPMKNGA